MMLIRQHRSQKVRATFMTAEGEAWKGALHPRPQRLSTPASGPFYFSLKVTWSRECLKTAAMNKIIIFVRLRCLVAILFLPPVLTLEILNRSPALLPSRREY